MTGMVVFNFSLQCFCSFSSILSSGDQIQERNLELVCGIVVQFTILGFGFPLQGTDISCLTLSLQCMVACDVSFCEFSSFSQIGTWRICMYSVETDKGAFNVWLSWQPLEVAEWLVKRALWWTLFLGITILMLWVLWIILTPGVCDSKPWDLLSLWFEYAFVMNDLIEVLTFKVSVYPFIITWNFTVLSWWLGVLGGPYINLSLVVFSTTTHLVEMETGKLSWW